MNVTSNHIIHIGTIPNVKLRKNRAKKMKMEAQEGPPVDFLNPIEKLEGATKHKRELKYYNSEVHSAAFALPRFLKREVSLLQDQWR
ncbi:hypothetical protein NC653_034317 [Populus alba x Populus x berolinensis]|uniref:Spermidine synthase n=1 Tax=Populus alba x Populus x berolinensis TaxID=444605 RepID=A0AAD6LM94_9ROSI|nr:hypothetical protein NC653_034317 [Populus alba x Populus x berolinensis]